LVTVRAMQKPEENSVSVSFPKRGFDGKSYQRAEH
jgi:hypothetical protein